MNHFFFKLTPPRPSFPMDITEREAEIMQQHSDYWSRLISERQVVGYGPVMDPNGTYGVAILEVDDDTVARQIAENDPAIKADAGFSFEIHQMIDAKVRM